MKNKDVVINQSELEWLIEVLDDCKAEFEELEQSEAWFTTKCIEKIERAVNLLEIYLHD